MIFAFYWYWCILLMSNDYLSLPSKQEKIKRKGTLSSYRINYLKSFQSGRIVLSDFLKVGQLNWVVGSWALGHGNTISWNGIGHVVVVYKVCERFVFVNLLIYFVLFVWNLAINAVFNVVVFQKMWWDFINTSSKLFQTVVRQGNAALFW